MGSQHFGSTSFLGIDRVSKQLGRETPERPTQNWRLGECVLLFSTEALLRKTYPKSVQSTGVGNVTFEPYKLSALLGGTVGQTGSICEVTTICPDTSHVPVA